MKSKKWMIWVGLTIVLGIVLGLAIWMAMSNYLQLGTVYRAQTTIEEHTALSTTQFVQDKIPVKNILATPQVPCSWE